MYISMNWISDFVDLSGIDKIELINKFSLSTAEVENEIFHKGSNVSGIVVAEIKSVENHPESKKLHLLKVDIGEDELVDGCLRRAQCPRRHEDCLCQVGRTDRRHHHCAAQAGGLYFQRDVLFRERNRHSDAQRWNYGDHRTDLPLGADLKSVYAIDDIVFEVDNKSLTNRPDLWGHYGIAREIAALAAGRSSPLILPIFRFTRIWARSI